MTQCQLENIFNNEDTILINTKFITIDKSVSLSSCKEKQQELLVGRKKFWIQKLKAPVLFGFSQVCLNLSNLKHVNNVIINDVIVKQIIFEILFSISNFKSPLEHGLDPNQLGSHCSSQFYTPLILGSNIYVKCKK